MVTDVLVTGGAGFVGSHLCERLIEKGYKVTVLDDLSTGSRDNIAHLDLELIVGSVSNLPQNIIDKSIECVFHLATHPRSFSLTDPLTNVEVNARGVINILELAKKHKAKVIYTSNSGIYGEPKFLPIDESHSVDPKTPYDANKLVGEYYCTIYSRVYGIPTIVFRLATVYGERQRVHEKLQWKPVIAEFCKRVIMNQKPTINGDGNQTRDFIYVKDVVQGLIKGLENKDILNDMFNLSTGTETTINDLLSTIVRITGINVEIKRAPELVGDIRRMCYSWKKVKERLGYRPEYALEDGIRRYIQWMKEDLVKVQYL